MSQNLLTLRSVARSCGLLGLAVLAAACGGTSSASHSPSTATSVPSAAGSSVPGSIATPGMSTAPGASSAPTDTSGPTDTAAPTAEPGATGSPEPDATSGTTTGGDIPDNAVFLTYDDATHGFAIQYVEGWQVTPTSDGVVIQDKDSSETVQIVPPVSDVKAYIQNTDLPALQQTDGFRLLAQDTLKVHGKQIDHLSYQQLSPPDPVTGKRLPSLVDRYYVPGANGLAVVSLSTPKGVDNVDAFKQMIESFTWK
jgi:hypothetical protein